MPKNEALYSSDTLEDVITMTSESRLLAIVSDIVAMNGTRKTFATAFPTLFENHYGRPFDASDAHDLMIAEGVFSEAFRWLGDDGVIYR